MFSDTLKIANKYEIPIYARGAGTGLTGGAVPLMGGIVFDLKSMNRIIEICPEDFVLQRLNRVLLQKIYRMKLQSLISSIHRILQALHFQLLEVTLQNVPEG